MNRYWQLPVQSYRVVDWNKWAPAVWQAPVVLARCLQENVLGRKNLAGNYRLPAWHHTWCCEHRLFWQDKLAQHWEWLLGIVLPDIEQLGTEQLGTGLPGTEQLGTEQLGTGLPGFEQLGTGLPGFEQLGTGLPGTEQLGTGLPGFEQLGTACGDSQGCYHIVD